MALQHGIQDTKISWEQFEFWYQGFEHSFKSGIGGPTTDQINEIRRQLARVRGCDYYSQAASTNTATNQYSEPLDPNSIYQLRY